MGPGSRGVMRWWLLMGSFPSVHSVAGMCKLDQVSPLSPGECSYHNQVRYAATSQQHDPSHAGHLLIFTCISWPLSFNISALDDEKYLNIKNILRACKWSVCWRLTWVSRWVLCVPSSGFLFPSTRLEGKAVICAATRFIRVIGFMVMVYCSQFVNSKNMEGWCLKWTRVHSENWYIKW